MADRFFPLARGFIVTSPFGPRDDGFHAGVDFGKEGGSGGLPVYAVQAGTVLYAGAASGYGGDPNNPRVGWLVIDSTDAEGAGVWEYGHIIGEVGVGDHVIAGQRIATINPSSATNGGVAPHCHVSHMPREYSPGKKDDPLPYLQGANYPDDAVVGAISADPLKIPETFFADVSEFQPVVDDQYPHRILIIRSNDGDYRDKKFQQNYTAARQMLDAGKLDVLGVYFYWRSNWQTCVDVHKQMIAAAGGMHPRVFSMIDLESGYGNQQLGDQSAQLNATRDRIAVDLYDGDRTRVIAYANSGDFSSMWPTRPADLRVIGAGYPTDPQLPGQIAHQYTNGEVVTPIGPRSCPPFGNCDMNKSSLSVADFAAAVGIALPGGTVTAPKTDSQRIKDTREQLAGFDPTGKEDFVGWPQLGNRTVVNALAAIGEHLGIDGFKAPEAKK